SPTAVEQAAPEPEGEAAPSQSEIKQPSPREPADMAPAAEGPSPRSGSSELPAAEFSADEDLPAESESPGTRHRRGLNGTPVLVSDLLPLSVLSTGRTGRRRAEDRGEGSGPIDDHLLDDHPGANRADQLSSTDAHKADAHRPADGPAGMNGIGTIGTAAVATGKDGPAPDVPEQDDPAQDSTAQDSPAQDGSSAARLHTGPMLSLAPLDPGARSEPTLDIGINGSAAADDGVAHSSREFPVVGPPLAPAPRALEWGSNGSAGRAAEAADVGMGDLLAEALAAFQESGHSFSTGTDTSDAHGVDMMPVPGSGTRGQRRHWTSGVRLATDPVDRRSDNAAEALTDPELRLPDLTAEPLWQPPGTGRRSTAGD
ncbi:MAG TPA: hypothetical protein VHH34_00220, partial [Pseudonocardiaceae bacterium]|nr:hypothetical protein [Pseudonocardiaceae bacterium]